MASLKKKQPWFLSTIIWKGITRFSVSMEKRYEKRYDVQKKKKIKLAFEIGLQVNETRFLKTTVTKNDSFFTYVNVYTSQY